MENELIPAFKDTILNPIETNLGDTIMDIAELGLDSILQEGMLRDVPVFGTIFSLCKTGVNIKERHLIRKTAKFITSFNQSELSDEQIKAYRIELEEDPKKAEKELGRVIILLDRMMENQQAYLLGRFYSAYIRRAISWDKFIELSEVNMRMFQNDYAVLDSIARKPIKKNEEISDKRIYQIQRLQSLGLVMEKNNVIRWGDFTNEPSDDERFVITPLGGALFSLMERD